MKILQESPPMRLDEARLSRALDSIVNELMLVAKNNLEGDSPHVVDIRPNYARGVVDVTFKDTGIHYEVQPGVVNVDSVQKARPVSIKNNYPKATYNPENHSFYIRNERIGTAYVSVDKETNVRDYSDKLTDATFHTKDEIPSKRKFYSKLGASVINRI